MEILELILTQGGRLEVEVEVNQNRFKIARRPPPLAQQFQ